VLKQGARRFRLLLLQPIWPETKYKYGLQQSFLKKEKMVRFNPRCNLLPTAEMKFAGFYREHFVRNHGRLSCAAPQTNRYGEKPAAVCGRMKKRNGFLPTFLTYKKVGRC